MSWDKLEIQIHQESFKERNEILSGKKGNDSMNLQSMTIEELNFFKVKIDQEIKVKEEKAINAVTEEFLQVWKKMEKLGIMVKTEELGTYLGRGGEFVKDLQIEINGNLIEIYK